MQNSPIVRFLRSSKNYGHSPWLDSEAECPSRAPTEQSHGRDSSCKERRTTAEAELALAAAQKVAVFDGVLLNM